MIEFWYALIVAALRVGVARTARREHVDVRVELQAVQ